MRLLSFLILIFAGAVDPVLGQAVMTETPVPTIAPSPSPAGTPTKFRPILMSTEPTGLINKVDRLSVAEQNPNPEAVMFYCVVNKKGKVVSSAIYRELPGSEPLARQIRNNVESSSFIPALYNSKPVDAIYYGAAVFSVLQGRPRFRIFANQETAELTAENDFIGPQPVYGGDSKFLGLHYPKKADGKTNGIAELNLQIDQEGNLKRISVLYEYPTDRGFGEAALVDFKDAKFVPAFRNGEPVECTIRLPVYYQAPPR
jgi:TonB family protein